MTSKKTSYENLARRIDEGLSDNHTRRILLTQLFSTIALIALVAFMALAFLERNTSMLMVLVIFTFLVIVNYFFLNITRNIDIASLGIVLLMGALCLYLFYTGGAQGTGLLWSYVFIPVAVFLGGLHAGMALAITLLAVMMITLEYLPSWLHYADYTSTFIIRFASIYIILTLLAGIHEFFRQGSQRYLEAANRHLDVLYRTDELTGLYNRHHVMEQLAYEILRLQRSRTPFSIILFDIDHFKKVNDMYGHACGDHVLKCVSSIVSASIRRLDVAARVGGEEFMILAPGTHLHTAAIVAERLRKNMEQYQFTYGGHEFHTTISLGVTEAMNNQSPTELMHIADDNLYKAKHRGRNQLVAA